MAVALEDNKKVDPSLTGEVPSLAAAAAVKKNEDRKVDTALQEEATSSVESVVVAAPKEKEDTHSIESTVIADTPSSVEPVVKDDESQPNIAVATVTNVKEQPSESASIAVATTATQEEPKVQGDDQQQQPSNGEPLIVPTKEEAKQEVSNES